MAQSSLRRDRKDGQRSKGLRLLMQKKKKKNQKPLGAGDS